MVMVKENCHEYMISLDYLCYSIWITSDFTNTVKIIITILWVEQHHVVDSQYFFMVTGQGKKDKKVRKQWIDQIYM